MFDINAITPQKIGKNRWLKLEKLPFYGDLNLGNGTMFKVGIFYTPRRYLFIGIEKIGAFAFNNEGYKSARYVAEKLNLLSGDSANIADFINAQLGIEGPEQGSYEDRFMYMY